VGDLRQLTEHRKSFSTISKTEHSGSHSPLGSSELASSGDAPQARGYSICNEPSHFASVAAFCLASVKFAHH
jgi:hypothetical protein